MNLVQTFAYNVLRREYIIVKSLLLVAWSYKNSVSAEMNEITAILCCNINVSKANSGRPFYSSIQIIFSRSLVHLQPDAEIRWQEPAAIGKKYSQHACRIGEGRWQAEKKNNINTSLHSTSSCLTIAHYMTRDKENKTEVETNVQPK